MTRKRREQHENSTASSSYVAGGACDCSLVLPAEASTMSASASSLNDNVSLKLVTGYSKASPRVEIQNRLDNTE